MASNQVSVERIGGWIDDSLRAIGGLKQEREALGRIGAELVGALKSGGKVLTAGNGGSAAEALHMAEEFVGRFKSDRPPLPAIALVADPTALTCIGNDFGYDEIFKRQVEALGRPGDMLFLFSTSGNSRNVLLALDAAERKGLKTVCLLGREGGLLAGRGTHEIIIRSREAARIQEAHQVNMHVLLDIVEDEFGEK